MRGSRLFDHTMISIEQIKKKVVMSEDLRFSLKISVKTKKKRSSLFVMRPLIFSVAPHFLRGSKLQPA